MTAAGGSRSIAMWTRARRDSALAQTQPVYRDESSSADRATALYWQQIVERRDVLAAAAAGAVLQWDGGKAWPVGHMAQFDPASSPAAAEWTARLSPAPATHGA
jgi:hypothetical protein